MTIIRDPSTGKGAEVSPQGHLVTRAVFESELEHESAENGFAYAWDSTELDIAAADSMLYVKNTGDMPLHLEYVQINGSNTVCTWTIQIGALTTTPSGNTVTGVNLNQIFSGLPAQATSISNETAVAAGAIVGRVKTAIDGHHIHPMAGVILGKDHYVQIVQITESTRGSVTLVGHYVPA